MSKNKILIKITGSIAAYKVGHLISKLVQNNFEVQTVVTQSALNFIGKATLEGLTGHHVYTDSFEDGKMMSHIDLTKWADLTILVPADANTINKYSSGIADNLVTSLFLAHNPEKPYLISPAMNTQMYNHPATQESLKKLTSWGITILPTEEGYLACGDIGKGKLLNPDLIYDHIVNSIFPKKNGRKVLITSGGTKENIDNIRSIANMSTGSTGSTIAEYFSRKGYDVTFLKSTDSLSAKNVTKQIEFDNFKSIEEKLKDELHTNSYDMVIHLAAISDYSPISLKTEDEELELPSDSKLNSRNDSIMITLKKNKKIINEIKNCSVNKNVKLVGFKLVSNTDVDKDKIINKLFADSNSDLIVYNSWSDREDNTQKDFEVTTKNGDVLKAENTKDLAIILEKYISEVKWNFA